MRFLGFICLNCNCIELFTWGYKLLCKQSFALLNCKCELCCHFPLIACVAAFHRSLQKSAQRLLYTAYQRAANSMWYTHVTGMLGGLPCPTVTWTVPAIRQGQAGEGIYSGAGCLSRSLVCVSSLVRRHLCVVLFCCCTCVSVFLAWFNFALRCLLKRSKWTQAPAFCRLT